MNKSRQQNALNPLIRNEATEWLLRFSEGEIDTNGREEFSRWLRTSPECVRAYLRVAAFWQAAGRIGKQPRDIDALISQARREDNIFPLTSVPRLDEVDPSDDVAKPAATRWSLAIAATVLVTIGAVMAHQHLTRNTYESRIGEQRTLNLADGSTLVLNADSRVEVRYSETERTIDLERGQALFKVAKNPSRPFVVRSGSASVRAVGTQFDVHRKSTGTTVTVVEGKVAARAAATPADGAADQVFLMAGEQLTLPEISVARTAATTTTVVAAALKVRPVKVTEATAWTEGLLIFDGTALSEVIQEFNRQNAKPLVLDSDLDLLQLKISGTFPANGAERLSGFLRERFGVVVHETGDEIRLSRH